ncbi:hypothetical protein [Streptomyces sp. NPDC023327]|uniref:hypothetical protein n=1 Tax=Streptomyces sp. NPDC023327 TaxID=3157088 RepID=UPI0033CAD4BA
MDVDCTTASVVALLQCAALRGDVQGPLDALGRARGHPIDVPLPCYGSAALWLLATVTRATSRGVRRRPAPVYRHRRRSSARTRRARSAGGHPRGA